MKSGESPQHAAAYYHYLQAHQETLHVPATWHVDWLSLAWLWQYRSTRQKAGIYPIDNFAGYTPELAGPATFFFLALTVLLTAFAVAIIVGHLVWGQKF